MRYLLLIFIFINTGCSGQQTKDRQSKIDTLKLFDPKPEPPSAQDAQMFKNCMVLLYPGYKVIHNNTENSFYNPDSLADFLKTNAASIRKKKFYLISDSSTKYSKIISAIDFLRDTKISDYKVINYQEYFAPPESVAIQTPISTSAVPNEIDSTYFAITILKNSLEVKLLNYSTQLKTPLELDNFIIKHKLDIDIRKILIISSKDFTYDKFKPIFEVLKKHEYSKYNLIAK